MNRTREQWKQADANNLAEFRTTAFHAITNAKADIEELHEENARLRAQVTELVKALKQYADPMNWGYRDEGGCEKGHGKYEDACFVGREIAEAAIAAAEGGAE